MKYQIQRNSDGTYTVLEISDQDVGMIYVVDKSVVQRMHNLAFHNELQLITYDEKGNIEYIFLKLRRYLLKRNKSIVLAALSLYLLYPKADSGFSDWFYGGIFAALLLYIQYYRMFKLKKKLDNQKFIFPVRGKEVCLRETKRKSTNKYWLCFFIESIGLFSLWLELIIGFCLNNNKTLIFRSLDEFREEPIYNIAGGMVWVILLILIFLSLALLFFGVLFLRKKIYTSEELAKNYYGLKARLTDENFEGWIYDQKIAVLEGCGMLNLNDDTDAKVEKRVQEIYKKYW